MGDRIYFETRTNYGDKAPPETMPFYEAKKFIERLLDRVSSDATLVGTRRFSYIYGPSVPEVGLAFDHYPMRPFYKRLLKAGKVMVSLSITYSQDRLSPARLEITSPQFLSGILRNVYIRKGLRGWVFDHVEIGYPDRQSIYAKNVPEQFNLFDWVEDDKLPTPYAPSEVMRLYSDSPVPDILNVYRVCSNKPLTTSSDINTVLNLVEKVESQHAIYGACDIFSFVSEEVGELSALLSTSPRIIPKVVDKSDGLQASVEVTFHKEGSGVNRYVYTYDEEIGKLEATVTSVKW